MTDQELKDIVAAVMAELEKSGVDFDFKIDTPESTDLIFVVRGDASSYQGTVVTWKGLLDIITAKAEQAKKDAVEAQKKAETSEANASNSETNVSNMKFAIEQMQSDVSEMKETVVAASNSAADAANAASTSESNTNTYMQNAQQAKSAAEIAQGKAEEAKGLAESAKNSAESAMGSAEAYMESAKQSARESRDNVERFLPIDFRVTDPNSVILDVDVTGTMGAFMDGMEQEPNEAIALTLEPDVPTVDTHNFGVRGQICIDGNYLYVCVADNTWKKIPLQEL
jgi:hypothetical protein